MVKVRHRPDDLEIQKRRFCNDRWVRHRPDDLEKG